MTLILSGTNGLSDVDGSAATPAIRGTDANTGIFFGADTVGIATNGTAAVSINASQVVTLTNALAVTSGGTGVTTSTGSGAVVLGTSPTLTTPTINSAQIPTVSGSAPLYMCRAWVNFNGTGTISIRGSGNVSSISDNGTGNYTMNFTTAMPDTTYSAVGTCGSPSVSHGIFMFVKGTGTITGTGGVQFGTVQTNAADSDYVFICAAVFR